MYCQYMRNAIGGGGGGGCYDNLVCVGFGYMDIPLPFIFNVFDSHILNKQDKMLRCCVH